MGMFSMLDVAHDADGRDEVFFEILYILHLL